LSLTSTLPAITPIPTHPRPHLRPETLRRLSICAAMLALLILWAILWPQSGDGDAITHFISARDGLHQPWKLMGSWARVGAMLFYLIPAQFGILPARCMAAVVSIICAWQTMRMADDLALPHAIWAGPMLIFQPLVFALAADTMTEIPMALGLVIAIRLWWRKRWLASALVMSYLPTVRPEGFFLCALWGAMFLFNADVGNIWRRLPFAAALATGTLAWMIAAHVFCGDAGYFLHRGWGWPADSRALYGSGSFFSYINRIPFYCGAALFPLFLIGLRGLLRWPRVCVAGLAILPLELIAPPSIRETVLPFAMLGILGAFAWVWRREKIAIAWWAFLLVLSVHSILWWRGWFASAGLLRILACVSPVIAVICLRGWNQLQRAPLWVAAKRIVTIALLVLMPLTAMDVYAIDPIHYRIFGMRATTQYAIDHHLLDAAPRILVRDPIAQPLLGHDVFLPLQGRAAELRRLATAPVGSIVFWDDQREGQPQNVNLRDLSAMGYQKIFEYTQTIHRPIPRIFGRDGFLDRQKFEILSKAHG